MDDDEDRLPLEQQTERPPDLALHQQRIPAWHPILDPVWVIIGLFYLGVIMVPTGYKMQQLSDNVVELKSTYDYSDDGATPICGINTTYNANRMCTIEFTPQEDMRAPILIHYELTNFHQNHKTYESSFDVTQLAGGDSDDAEENCAPLYKLGDITLNPCGYQANTFFNDKFTLMSGDAFDGEPLKMFEEGIAWQSDLQYKFSQPDDFAHEECPDDNCDASCCDGDSWSCSEPYLNANDEKCYRYYYPDDNTTQYLYETYSNLISPLEGVENEHFIVWMRLATLPDFRKLYGYIDQSIPAGNTITFQIDANFVVESFGGTKSLILSTNNIFGGKNDYLGRSFIWFGYFCIATAFFFMFKHWCSPRKLGDKQYLHYKLD